MKVEKSGMSNAVVGHNHLAVQQITAEWKWASVTLAAANATPPFAIFLPFGTVTVGIKRRCASYGERHTFGKKRKELKSNWLMFIVQE